MNKLPIALAGLGGTAILALTLGTAQDSEAAIEPSSTIALAAWTQYVDGGSGNSRIDGRVVLDNSVTDCSGIKFAADAKGVTVVVATLRNNPDPSLFPVTVCQAQIDSAWADVYVMGPDGKPMQVLDSALAQTDLVLSGPAAVGRKHPDEIRLISLGDSGCQYEYPRNSTPTEREKIDKLNQCVLSDWTFNATAISAAGQSPDVVLHVGDYRYHKQLNDSSGAHPDSWAYWRLDFFRPGQALLASAPWIMVRGNHENCPADYGYSGGTTYSSMGYNYFLQANVTSQTDQCIQATSQEPFTQPNWSAQIPSKTDSAGKPIAGHEIIVLDTAPDANSKPHAGEHDNTVYERFKAQFETAIKDSSGKSVWWTTHKPPMSLERYSSTGSIHQDDDDTRNGLEGALGGADISVLCQPPQSSQGCAPSLLMVGHEHFYQYIDYAGDDSPDIAIVGNGGVAKHIDPHLKSKCSFDNFDSPFENDAVVETSALHGYTMWHRTVTSAATDSAGWTRTPVFLDDPNPKWQGDDDCAKLGNN